VIVDGVFYAAALLMATFATVALRKGWRNEGPLDTDKPSLRWPGSLAAWRGHVRCQSVCGPVALLLGTAAVVIDRAGGSADAPHIVAAMVGLPVAILVFVAMPFVYLFNKPKWLVAPHLRHQPGRISEALGDPVRPTPAPGSATRERLGE
jgi:hypothetical protein